MTTNNFERIAVANSVAVIIFSLLVSCSAAGSNPDVFTVKSETQARRIATKEFEKFTRAKIKKVSVEKFEETTEQWTFRFVGKDEFARPGFHWHVTVDKKTGKAETISGE